MPAVPRPIAPVWEGSDWQTCGCTECHREYGQAVTRYGIAITQWEELYGAQAQENPQNMNKYIDRMGVEIEGGWSEEPQNLQHDGSVSAPDSAFKGESVSPPFSKFRDLIRYVQNNYPDEANKTCGLHIHFSLTSVAYYSRMMDRGFQAHFYDYMKKWAKDAKPGDIFTSRLLGRNQYCKTEWHPDLQVAAERKGEPRYTAWNFCYRLHGTAECRLLPTFPGDVDMAIAGIRAVKASLLTWLRMADKLADRGVLEHVDETILEEPDDDPKRRNELQKIVLSEEV